MNNKVAINILKDKFKKKFFLISIYNKYNYKQYIYKKSILYTFFIIINFLYKYGFIKLKKNVRL
jgi:hypothetical protein